MRWWLAIGGVISLVLAAALGDDVVRPDPLPLRRVQIGADRVAGELERVQKGMLVLLPRKEFEAKVQDAALAAEIAASPPRLIQARYTAELADQGLVGGAEWSVVHSAPGPGVLPLTDFNLAMRNRAKVNGEDGIVGDLDGKNPGFWIDKPGQATIQFDWSRRGTPVDGQLHFDLQIPACANAQLNLKLPADHRLVASKPGLQIDGPEAADDSELRTWLVSFSGRSHVEFTLRRLETGATLLFASVQSCQELGPDRVLADYDFQIEALHGTVAELRFDGDGPLQPYDVSIGGVEVKNWQWQPVPAGQQSTGAGALVVPLREPLYGALPPVRVRCLAPVMKDKKDRAWVSPGLRLRGALSRGETLVLHALPEAQLESWKPGQFRLVRTSSEADGAQILTLTHGGQVAGRPPATLVERGQENGKGGGPPAVQPRRPSAVLKARTTEFLVEQQSWWQVDAQGSTLTSEIACKLSRGQLYHLALKLPAESQVDRLTVEPKELLRGWATAGTLKTPLLLIDLAQPATPERPVKMQVQLRLQPRTVPLKGLNLPFPDIEPQSAYLRDAKLGISIHPSWRAQVMKSSVTPTSAPEGEALWGRTSPEFHFAFRGTPPTGQLRLSPRASQFQARSQSDVFLGSDRGALVARLTIEPTSGTVNYVDLVVSTALAEPWKVRGESTAPRVVSIAKLPGLDALSALVPLGAQGGLESLGVLAGEPGLERWRLRFAEPVRTRVTLVLEAPFDRVEFNNEANANGERPWIVPVVGVLGADQFDGELAVQLVGAEITGAETDQLEEVARQPGKRALPRAVQQVWRVYRYGSAGASGKLPSLRVKARAIAMIDLAGRETCDTAALTTWVESDGRLMHHFRFQLLNWRKPDVPVQLPAGAQLLAARTEGRWLPSLPQQAQSSCVQIELPANGAALTQSFELYYTTPREPISGALWQVLAAPVPQLPVHPLDLHQTWMLPPGLVPLAEAWQQVASEANVSAAKERADARLMPRPGQPLPGPLGPESFSADWTQWELANAAGGRVEMVVVRPGTGNGFGILLSGVLAMAWVLTLVRMQSAGWRKWSVRLLVLWAGVATLAAVWLPDSIRGAAAWPAATAMTLLAVRGAGCALKRPSSSSVLVPGRARSSAVAAALALALALTAASLPPAWSQSPDVGIVLVLPGPAEAPDREDVLVTPELLKKLDSLVQRAPHRLDRAVLTAVHYEAAAAGDVVQFKASFQLYSFGAKATLPIPLGGVELREGALLDGAGVHPVASAGGYTIEVQGQGPHQLTLEFTVRLQAGADHRDLQFTAPRLLHSVLVLRTPLDWPEAQAISGLGVAESATMDANHQELTADLGRDPTVHIRWAGYNPAVPAAKVTVQEAYFWDLRSPGSKCTAVLNYMVKGGSVSWFTLNVSNTLEPRFVEVAGGEDAVDETSQPQLRDWRLVAENGAWHLYVQLQGPATGHIVLTVHLVPRHPLGPGTVRLPLPAPLGAKSIGGILGYRVEGFEPTNKAFNLKTTALAAAQFTDLWQQAGGHDAVLPKYAFKFSGRQADSALVVSLTTRQPMMDQDLLWTIQPGRADLQANLKAKAGSEDIALIEWDVPPQVVVAEITGDNIRSWTRPAGDARVQVWLKQPAKSAAVNLRGWLLHAEPPVGQAVRWALPMLNIQSASTKRTVVRVVASGGVRVDPDLRRFANLIKLPAPATSAWVSQGPTNFYRAEFMLRTAPQPARVQAMTTIDAPPGKLRISSQWQVQVPHGALAKFQVVVRNWQGPPITLEGPGVSKLDASAGQQRWQVIVAAGAPRKLQLKLTAVRPCQAGTVVDLPVLDLDGAVWTDHWLAAQTPGLDVRTAVGLTPVKDISAAPSLPPGTAERLGLRARVWKTAAPDWKLALVVRPPVATPGLRMLLAEQEVAFGEGFGWIHQTGFLIHVKDSSELTIAMPPDAVLLTATVNCEQVNPRFLGADRLVVALAPGDGLQHLQLRWVAGTQAEPVVQPQLTVPRVEGAPAAAINWTLAVPPGHRLADSVEVQEQTPALATARQELARAKAQAEATQLLVEQLQKMPDETVRSQVLTCQILLEAHCHLAAKALEGNLDPAADDTIGRLKEHLTSLEQHNAVTIKKAGLDMLRIQGDTIAAGNRKMPGSLVFSRGTVVRWQASAEVQQTLPDLVAVDDDQLRQTWTVTFWLALTVLGMLALSFFPRAANTLRRLWPEQIAVLAILAWIIWDVALVASIFLLLALIIRLIMTRHTLQPSS